MEGKGGRLLLVYLEGCGNKVAPNPAAGCVLSGGTLGKSRGRARMWVRGAGRTALNVFYVPTVCQALYQVLSVPMLRYAALCQSFPRPSGYLALTEHLLWARGCVLGTGSLECRANEPGSDTLTSQGTPSGVE